MTFRAGPQPIMMYVQAGEAFASAGAAAYTQEHAALGVDCQILD